MSEARTILYIDDEPQVAENPGEDLRAAGYRLFHTADPDEVLRLVRVEEIDLVLVEVVLSTCDGIALLEEIRSYGGWPAEVPIIVLTKGERTPDLYGDALGLGVKEFFTKPAPNRELLDCVRKFIGKSLEPSDVDPSEESSAPESEAAISGDLAETPISEVFRRLQREAASGVLTVARWMDRKAFELRNGSVMATSFSGGLEAAEEYLARCGHITQEQLRSVKERVGRDGGSSREALVERGAISEEKLGVAIAEQAEELLLETFGWTSGAFHYFPGKRIRADVAFEIDRSHAALMFDGVRHWSPQEVAVAELRPRASRYVSAVEDPPCEFAELDLSFAERACFEDLLGHRSVQEVLDSDGLDAVTLYGLFAAGFIVFHEEQVMLLLDAVRAEEEPPPELSFADLSDEELEERPEETPEKNPLADATPDWAEDVPAAMAQPPLPDDPPATKARAELTLAELTALCERNRRADDFDVLGVGEEVSDAEVLDAYERLCSILPSEAALSELPDLEALADEARRRIDRAFTRLRLSSSRRICAQLRPQAGKGSAKVKTAKARGTIAAEKRTNFEELAARGLDAEAWFRRGHSSLAAKDYEHAIEAYGMAAHLDPKEGEYLARLGYAQFLGNPKDAVVLREALENIARGIKLCPNREKPYVYLGKIFRQNGAEDRARKMFRNALRINPSCEEALQSLRLLDQRDQRETNGGKLLDRLKDILK